DVRRDDGKPCRHRLENRVRYAFGKRGEHEAVQATQELRHVRALACEPGELPKAGLRQYRLRLLLERALTHYDQSQMIRRGRLHLEREDERTNEVQRVLDSLEPADD